MNVKLILQYDGANYHGWQVQKNGVTVQETLSDAIEGVVGEKVSVIGCGRTDAGVHALGFVCNFHTKSRVLPEKYPYAINSHLPDDIRVINAEEVGDDFHAKNSAVKKRYIYRILNRNINDVFEGKYAWHYRFPLNIEAMRYASEAFLGEHDFIGFASSGFTVKTTVRTIYSLDILKSGDIITIDVCGNGFLYNMVRIIAGTLVYAGSGKINPGDMEMIINSKKRDMAGITAPANGLFLKEVYYGRN